MGFGPHARGGPVAEVPPAGGPGGAAEFGGGESLPADALARDEDDAARAGEVVGARPAALTVVVQAPGRQAGGDRPREFVGQVGVMFGIVRLSV